MAEALSIIPLVIEGVKLVNRLGHTIKGLKEVPHELMALANEVNDISLVLNEIQETCEGAEEADENVGLGTLLIKAKTHLEQLQHIVDEFSNIPFTVRNRYKFWKKKDDLQKLMTEIQEVRESLMAMVVIRDSNRSERIDLNLSEVKFIGRDLLHVHKQSAEHVSTLLSEQQILMRAIVQELMNVKTAQSQQVNLLEQISLVGERYRGSRRLSEHHVDGDSPLPLPLPSPDSSWDSAPGRGPEVLEESNLDIADKEPDFSNLLGSLAEICSDTSIQGLSVAVNPRRESDCRRGCSCFCHRQTRFRSPSPISMILGSFLLGYSGSITASCSEWACRKRSTAQLKLTYFFPRWFIYRRMIMLQLSMSRLIPTLQVCRIVPFEAEVLSAAAYGDLELMKSLLRRRVASPFDVSLEGDSALIWAVEHGQKDICRLMIENGADADAENMDGYSASDIAWTKILGKTSADEEYFRTQFPITDDFEGMDFSALHRIVLGLSQRDLREELTESTAAINYEDAKSRTPLSWAVQRGDVEKAKILLQFGANPNAADRTERSLFRWSVWPIDSACTRLLIDYGANVNHKDIYGNTPLHYASWFNSQSGHADALVSAGADINARSFEGNKPSPLHLACWQRHDDTAALLIKAGAILNSKDTINLFFLTVEENMVQARTLWPQHFDCTSADMEGNTIAHAAAYSTISDLENLIAMNLEGLNPETKNVDGMTPFDLLDRQRDITTEFRLRFQGFLDALAESQIPETMRSSWSSANMDLPGAWIA